MAFLNPYLLLGMFAVGAPLLLHLLLRDKPVRMVLPTMRFLPQSSPQTMAMHRMKNILLLLMRLAVLILIVLAFSRPYFSDGSEKPVAPTTVDSLAVFAVDTSLSMRAENHAAEAAQRIKILTADITPQRRAALITFDDQPHLACPPTGEKSDFTTALETANKPGWGGTDLNAAVRSAVELANGFEAPRRTIYLVSDMQDNGFRQISTDLNLPKGIELVPIQIGKAQVPNAAIASAQELTQPGERMRRIRVQVMGYATHDLPVELSLNLNGKSLVQRAHRLNDKESWVTDFVLPLPVETEQALTAKLTTNDGLADDNELAILLPAQRPIPLLVAAERGMVNLNPGPHANLQNPYLDAALDACGPALQLSPSSPLEISKANPVNLPAALVSFDRHFSDAEIAQLKAYAEAGGALILMPGATSGAELQPLAGTQLTGWQHFSPDGNDYRRVSAGGQAGADNSAGSQLLGFAKTFDYLIANSADAAKNKSANKDLNASTDKADGLAALIQLDDGSPFLLRRKLGQGMVYFFTVPPQPAAGEWVLTPGFAPFLLQLIRQAAHFGAGRGEFKVGERIDQDCPAGARVGKPGGEWTLANETRPRFDRPGLWQVEKGSGMRTLAVRLDKDESDLKPMDADRVKSLAQAGSGLGRLAHGSALGNTEEPKPAPDATQRLWWYCLLAAAVFLGFETLLAGRTLR